MSAVRIANRYAKSLLDLALERNVLPPVYEDVRMVQNAITENRDLYLLLKSPIIKEDKKAKIILEIFHNKVNELTEKFLLTVVSKKREAYLLNIMEAFIGQYNKEKNITPVTIISATPLNEENKSHIVSLIKKRFGKQYLELNVQVDPTILGGFILKFEDKLYNASISHQLDEIRQEFNANEYVKRV